MSSQVTNSVRLPGLVPLFNPIARRLMRLGVPMGPNALLSGGVRRSGQTRTTPVALLQVGGRRWVIGTFGDVNWVRNLRAAREATITVGKRREAVTAVALSPQERDDFFASVLGPCARGLRLGCFLIGSVLAAGEILDDPALAASRRP